MKIVKVLEQNLRAHVYKKKVNLITFFKLLINEYELYIEEPEIGG